MSQTSSSPPPPPSDAFAAPSLSALMQDQKWEDVKRLLETNPDAARSKDKNNSDDEEGMIPFRIALRRKAPTDVLMKLIESNPEDAEESFGGITCLHEACQFHADLPVIDRLLSLWPEAASWKDPSGLHPLHYVCLQSSSEWTDDDHGTSRNSIIRAMIDACPASASISCAATDELYELPLHMAVSHDDGDRGRGGNGGGGGGGASLDAETLRALHEANPEAILTPTAKHGFLPLHLAMISRATGGTAAIINGDVVRTLLELHPAAASVPAKLCGSLPLHLAARNDCCSDDVLDGLLEAYPNAASRRTYGGDTPLTCAEQNTSPAVYRHLEGLVGH